MADSLSDFDLQRFCINTSVFKVTSDKNKHEM